MSSSSIVPARLIAVNGWNTAAVTGVTAFLESTPVKNGWQVDLVLTRADTQIRTQFSQIIRSWKPPEVNATVSLRASKNGLLAQLNHSGCISTAFFTAADLEKLTQIHQ